MVAALSLMLLSERRHDKPTGPTKYWVHHLQRGCRAVTWSMAASVCRKFCVFSALQVAKEHVMPHKTKTTQRRRP